MPVGLNLNTLVPIPMTLNDLLNLESTTTICEWFGTLSSTGKNKVLVTLVFLPWIL